MTRDETVAFFLECEARRAEARAAAPAQGKSGYDRARIAHEAAKAHWNAWSEVMLGKRKALEEAALWITDKFAQPQNDETRAWMEAARVDLSRCLFLIRGAGIKETPGQVTKEETDAEEPPVKSITIDALHIDLSGFVFPGRADFQSAAFSGEASFKSATFSSEADFESAAFSGDADFGSATFSGPAFFESTAFSGIANFDRAAFSGRATFQSAAFSGDAIFGSAAFSGDAIFGSATFSGFAFFESTAFSGIAIFESAAFSREAIFRSASFSDDAIFGYAAFSGRATFQSASFSGTAVFQSATFSGEASFKSAAFSDRADFESAAFSGEAIFESAAFSDTAFFQSVAFSGEASFKSASFSGLAVFRSVSFSGPASFRGQTFKNDIFFNGAKFRSERKIDFGLATFERVAQFDGALFEGETDFSAVWGQRTFSLAGARFEGVPDFIQAHFEEAPRLDNVEVEGRLLSSRQEPREEGKKLSRRNWLHLWLLRLTKPYGSLDYIYRRTREGVPEGSPLRDIPARWRALKRLAIQGHDTDRELQFFSGEVRSARFAGDWPLPWPIWKANAWGGFLRFWAGLLYQILSNFGRSLIRPFLAWALCIVIFAIYFLGQNEEMALRRDAHFGGPFAVTKEYTRTAWKAVWSPPHCYPGTPPDQADPPPPQDGFTGLVQKVRSQTNLVNEALSISYHNAVILLDSSADSAHRAFGCLYGVERYGGNPVAYVPRSVAIASGVQKLLSAVLIFLFGLAVRNMLKVK
jgi:Pentapeptide repeats (9 copies)